MSDIDIDVNVVEKVLSAIEDVCMKYKDVIIGFTESSEKSKYDSTDEGVFIRCIYTPISLLLDIVANRDKDYVVMSRVSLTSIINEFVEAIENAIRDFKNNKTVEYIGNIVGVFERLVDMVIYSRYDNLVKSDVAITAIEKSD